MPIYQTEPARLLVQLLTFEFLWLNPSSQYLESCLWLLKKPADSEEEQRQHCCGDRSVSSQQSLHTLFHLGLAGQRWAWCQAVKHRELAHMQDQARLIWSGPELYPHRLMTAQRTLAYSLTRSAEINSVDLIFPKTIEAIELFCLFLIIGPATKRTRSAIIIKPQGPRTLEKQHRSNRLKVRKL